MSILLVPGLHFVPWHRGSGCLGAAAPVTGAAADEYNLNVDETTTKKNKRNLTFNGTALSRSPMQPVMRVLGKVSKFVCFQ